MDVYTTFIQEQMNGAATATSDDGSDARGRRRRDFLGIQARALRTAQARIESHRCGKASPVGK